MSRKKRVNGTAEDLTRKTNDKRGIFKRRISSIPFGKIRKGRPPPKKKYFK